LEKDTLRRYRCLNREINRLLEEKKQWEELALKVTPGYSETPAGSGSGSGRIPSAVEKIIIWEEKIDAKIDELVGLRKEIEVLISGIDDATQREILYRRYILGHKWEKISADMLLDYRWVLRLHGRALQKLATKSHPDL